MFVIETAFVANAVSTELLTKICDLCQLTSKYYVGCDVVIQDANGISNGYTIFSEPYMPGLNYDDYAPVRFILPEVIEAFPQL